MRAIRFGVNWVTILTLPIYGGALLFGCLMSDMIKQKNFEGVASGKKWLWK